MSRIIHDTLASGRGCGHPRFGTPECERVAEALRAEFLRLLTVDSETKDGRRKEFNQAIFHPGDGSFGGGWAVFNGTDLDMVMSKFDKAVR